jgi:hypothetical protein
MTEAPPPQKVPLIFFRSGKGTEPVREWLKGLPEADRHAVGKDRLRAQWRWPTPFRVRSDQRRGDPDKKWLGVQGPKQPVTRVQGRTRSLARISRAASPRVRKKG